ncbi:MAG: EMC3/TMCO1 family protein [Candidatus Woesearchaeota archaeon]|nr:EMC3/TMCO1 family protein [Candidatus Woesearchaeota archaeon]
MSFLDPVLGPLLQLNTFLAIFIISLLISLIIIVAYKYLTNQKLMKEMKDDLKKYQAEMKQNKSDPKRVMEIQKKSMEINMKYMSHSMRPTLITLLPIILIYGWLAANFDYHPILPGQDFNVTLDLVEGATGAAALSIMPEGIMVLGNATQQIVNNKAMFKLNGKEGEYKLTYSLNNKTYSNELLITKGRTYKQPEIILKDSMIKKITVGNEKMIVMNLFGIQEGGWLKGRFGWLGTYIILSLIFSMGLRKLMKVY